MQVVVTGGRDFGNRQFVFDVLDERLRQYGQIELLGMGDARGVDGLAHEWAMRRRVPLLVYRADWKTHGRAAGPIRNGELLRGVEPDVVLAFPGGRGTADCVRQAKALGIRVERIEYGEASA